MSMFIFRVYALSLNEVIIPIIAIGQAFLVVNGNRLADVSGRHSFIRIEVLEHAPHMATGQRDRGMNPLGMEVKLPRNPKDYEAQAQE